ncbi:hypothetical protein KC19_VG333900 [Ceratodon purpureus]|uniref:Store-operated calcium entry-associated regulatory factor n=1 Tax=Ceratodon purpureus TaxID=3225 RepID=A0A8T0HX31_CERPU|nr:hypothetical protein KC19_VG333900 [Ceratodon purpureus]
MTHIKRDHVLFVLILGVILDTMEAEFVPNGRPVLLDEVKELHFQKGRETTYKRSPSLPQLRCTRGCEFEPDIVRCKNVKPRGRSSRWQCETNLPTHLKIGKTDIICEGFHSDEDEEVLEGSCALQYTLTHAGWALYGHKGAMEYDPKMKGWSASWIVISSVVGYIMLNIYNAVNWTQEFKTLLVRLRLLYKKFMRWLQGLRDETLPRKKMLQI